MKLYKKSLTVAMAWILLFSRSVVSDSFVMLWTVAHQAPLSMGFPRQEYWNGLPFLSPSQEPRHGHIQLAWRDGLLGLTLKR